ncbi:MAG: fibronectin type III domain-containing protein [Caldilineaceae bacterium]|nr:fibronectin type III domain-containing protein [Caldilineaceae bacterium]
MLPSKVRTSYPPGNLQKALVLLSTLILAISVIVLVGRRSVLAQDDTKAIGTVQIESTQPSELALSWDAPASTPRDYRVSWARVGENFKTWTDESGNAFPTDPSYTITGLDEGVRYKVKVRARYDQGGPGAWSEQSEAVVASAPTATSTATFTATPTTTATPTPTVTHTPTPEFTATATPTVAAPAQPQNLQAETTHSSVTLTWDDPGDSSITGYQILRRDPAVHERRLFTIIEDDTGSMDTQYVDDTVSSNTRYVFRVKARNAGD